MSIIIEQAVGSLSSFSGLSVSHSFPVTPTVGNMISIALSSYATGGSGGGIASVTDNQGNAYVVDAFVIGSGGHMAAVISGNITIASGTFTVTVTFNDDVGVNWGMMEVSFPAAGQLDAVGARNSFWTDPVVVTANFENTEAAELVVTCAVAVISAITGSPSTGYTDLYNDSASVNTGGVGSYKIVSGVELSDASFPYSASVEAAAVLATYRSSTAITPRKSGNLLMMWQ